MSNGRNSPSRQKQVGGRLAVLLCACFWEKVAVCRSETRFVDDVEVKKDRDETCSCSADDDCLFWFCSAPRDLCCPSFFLPWPKRITRAETNVPSGLVRNGRELWPKSCSYQKCPRKCCVSEN